MPLPLEDADADAEEDEGADEVPAASAKSAVPPKLGMRFGPSHGDGVSGAPAAAEEADTSRNMAARLLLDADASLLLLASAVAVAEAEAGVVWEAAVPVIGAAEKDSSADDEGCPSMAARLGQSAIYEK
jgi:hypothetical protein